MMNDLVVPKPILSDSQSLTFRRSDWEEFMDALETASDLADVARFDAQVAALGYDEVIRQCYTVDEARRLLDGASGLTIWRERAGLTQSALARQAKVSPSYLSEIENGKKPGSAVALKAIAAALGVPMEALLVLNDQP